MTSPIYHFHGTAAQRATQNGVSTAGQVYAEEDTGRFGVGDGSTLIKNVKMHARVDEVAAKADLDTNSQVPVAQLPVSTTPLHFQTTGVPSDTVGLPSDTAEDLTTGLKYLKGSTTWGSPVGQNVTAVNGDSRYGLRNKSRRLRGIANSGTIPVADHAHANGSQTSLLTSFTLSAAVGTAPAAGTSETWTVTSNTGVPSSAAPFAALVDGELVLVTVYATTSWTVLRGLAGTVTTHASGATVLLAPGPVDGGRFFRVQHVINQACTEVAAAFGNFMVTTDTRMPEWTTINPIQVRSMIEYPEVPLATPVAYNAGTTYAAAAMVTYSGHGYVSLVASNVGNTPTVGSTTTWFDLGDLAHIMGRPYDATYAYPSGAVARWHGAYWSATGATTGNEPSDTSTSWSIVAPDGGRTAWVQGTSYTAGKVVSRSGVMWMSLGTPAAGGQGAQVYPSGSSWWWVKLQAVPLHFAGEDGSRTATIAGGQVVVARPAPLNLPRGAVVFESTWVKPVVPFGSAGLYPVTPWALKYGTDSVVASDVGTAPSAPVDYTAVNGDSRPNSTPPVEPSTYSSGTTYANGAMVNDGSSTNYRSLQASNTAHTPSSSATWWEAIRYGFSALAITGVPKFGPGGVVSLAVIGDSIPYGGGDGVLFNNEGGGYWARALNNKVSWIRITKTSDTGFNHQAVTGAVRRSIALGATHVVWTHGVNDIGLVSGLDVNQLKQRVVEVAQIFADAGIPFLAATITPQTTSTDSWATTGNQTNTTGFGPDPATGTQTSTRSAYNQWLRATAGTAGCPIVDYVDVAAEVEVHNGTGWVWQASTTTDGTHPNTAAHTSIAASSAAKAPSTVVAAMTAPVLA